MMTAYSDGREPDRQYVGTLAECLMDWPREVAVAACSPLHGVPKEAKNFRPTAGQVMGWCEREAAWLCRMAARAGRREGGPLVLAGGKEKPASVAERCTQVARLRSAGRLGFGPPAGRRQGWFAGLAAAECERMLASLAAAAAAAAPAGPPDQAVAAGPGPAAGGTAAQ